ncbi:unnamed protein product [Amoebophrya sp. A25]|nr:unnamed protein product [Amoebophrya sp. A25]|eukprot:GSA25T00017649001.1
MTAIVSANGGTSGEQEQERLTPIATCDVVACSIVSPSHLAVHPLVAHPLDPLTVPKSIALTAAETTHYRGEEVQAFLGGFHGQAFLGEKAGLSGNKDLFMILPVRHNAEIWNSKLLRASLSFTATKMVKVVALAGGVGIGEPQMLTPIFAYGVVFPFASLPEVHLLARPLIYDDFRAIRTIPTELQLPLYMYVPKSINVVLTLAEILTYYNGEKAQLQAFLGGHQLGQTFLREHLHHGQAFLGEKAGLLRNYKELFTMLPVNAATKFEDSCRELVQGQRRNKTRISRRQAIGDHGGRAKAEEKSKKLRSSCSRRSCSAFARRSAAMAVASYAVLALQTNKDQRPAKHRPTSVAADVNSEGETDVEITSEETAFALVPSSGPASFVNVNVKEKAVAWLRERVSRATTAVLGSRTPKQYSEKIWSSPPLMVISENIQMKPQELPLFVQNAFYYVHGEPADEQDRLTVTDNQRLAIARASSIYPQIEATPMPILSSCVDFSKNYEFLKCEGISQDAKTDFSQPGSWSRRLTTSSRNWYRQNFPNICTDCKVFVKGQRYAYNALELSPPRELSTLEDVRYRFVLQRRAAYDEASSWKEEGSFCNLGTSLGTNLTPDDIVRSLMQPSHTFDHHDVIEGACAHKEVAKQRKSTRHPGTEEEYTRRESVCTRYCESPNIIVVRRTTPGEGALPVKNFRAYRNQDPGANAPRRSFGIGDGTALERDYACLNLELSEAYTKATPETDEFDIYHRRNMIEETTDQVAKGVNTRINAPEFQDMTRSGNDLYKREWKRALAERNRRALAEVANLWKKDGTPCSVPGSLQPGVCRAKMKNEDFFFWKDDYDPNDRNTPRVAREETNRRDCMITTCVQINEGQKAENVEESESVKVEPDRLEVVSVESDTFGSQ